MSKTTRVLGAFLVLAAVAWLAPGALSQEPIRIAYIDPLSGPFVSTGELMRDHVQYAVEDVTAKGGLFNGAKLQLLQSNARVSPLTAAGAAPAGPLPLATLPPPVAP